MAVFMAIQPPSPVRRRVQTSQSRHAQGGGHVDGRIGDADHRVTGRHLGREIIQTDEWINTGIGMQTKIQLPAQGHDLRPVVTVLQR